MSREAMLTRTLVQLADTLMDDFDLVELLSMLSVRCVEILDVAAAGIMLASPAEELRCVASSSEAMRILEIFEEESEEGPCPDCFRSGKPVVNMNLAGADGRWPRFGPKALALGFRSVHALPMHVRGRAIGALNLFRVDEGHLGEDDVVIAQALADVATISIIQQRATADAQAINEQLQSALNSRIVIEQAKGIVAASLDLDMHASFARLRDHARSANLKLGDVAFGVVDKSISPRALTPQRRGRPSATGGDPPFPMDTKM